MKFTQPYLPSLAGSVLVSHPELTDPNFSRTIIFVVSEAQEAGTVGVILNRQMIQTLGEYKHQSASSLVQNIPVYEGGPMDRHLRIIAGFNWIREDSVFRIHFGIGDEEVESLKWEYPEMIFRAFLGYSSWAPGQLQDELAEGAWLIGSVKKLSVHENSGDPWGSYVSELGSVYS